MQDYSRDEPTDDAVDAFIAKWQGKEGGAERANYALFLTELCDLLGVDRPEPADASTERIVWLNSFANERCGIARAPFSDKVPLEVENTVTLTDEGATTRLDLRSEPFGETAEERAFFEELFPSLAQGYGGTFDQLAAHLARGD